MVKYRNRLNESRFSLYTISATTCSNDNLLQIKVMSSIGFPRFPHSTTLQNKQSISCKILHSGKFICWFDDSNTLFTSLTIQCCKAILRNFFYKILRDHINTINLHMFLKSWRFVSLLLPQNVLSHYFCLRKCICCFSIKLEYKHAIWNS